MSYRAVSPWYHSDLIFDASSYGQDFYRNVEFLHEFHDKIIAERRAHYRASLEESAREMGVLCRRASLIDYKQRIKAMRDFQEQMASMSSGGRVVRPLKAGNAKPDPVGVGHRPRCNTDPEKPYRSLLDTLIYEEEKGRLTAEDIRSEVNTFVVMGHDVTSAAIMWTSYVLATEPEAQQRVQEELDDIFDGDIRPMTLADAQRMKYLEWCLKEAMRLYPPVPLLARDVTGDITVGGYTVPASSTVSVLVKSVHSDPKHWPEPEKFIPERFAPQNARGRHPYAYLAFSGGARNCIAQRVGLLQAKLVLAHLFRRFEVTTVRGRSKVFADPAIVLKPTASVRLRLKSRLPY